MHLNFSWKTILFTFNIFPPFLQLLPLPSSIEFERESHIVSYCFTFIEFESTFENHQTHFLKWFTFKSACAFRTTNNQHLHSNTITSARMRGKTKKKEWRTNCYSNSTRNPFLTLSCCWMFEAWRKYYCILFFEEKRRISRSRVELSAQVS